VSLSRTYFLWILFLCSDEEVSSPAPSVPGPSSPFGLGSDTDEEQGQQPGVEESSLADSSGAAGEAEQPEANGTTAGIQAQPTEHKLKDTKVKKEAGRAGVSDGSVLERSPTLGEDSDTEVDEDHKPGFADSETDVEEERIPVTPPVAPVKKNQVLLAVGIGDPEAPGVAHLQDCLAGSGTDVEDKTALDVPLERNHTPMVINSDTDEEEEEEEEEVSAALTLAHLKERGIGLWSRDPGAEEVKSQPQVLVEHSWSQNARVSYPTWPHRLSRPISVIITQLFLVLPSTPHNVLTFWVLALPFHKALGSWKAQIFRFCWEEM
jgi:mediator of DNA damage checkpoint protein 1